MNPLATTSNSRRWIGDGSDGNLTINDSVTTLASAKRGTPFNVRLVDESITSSTSSFYEVEITEMAGHLGVGLVREAEFQQGWKTKGMFFNGNLTNGSAGLLIGFGDHPNEGDTVGVYLQRTGAEVVVIFYLNGRCLGPGFHLETQEVFYPCLHVDGRAVVKYTAPQSFPSVVTREAAQHADVYSGDWIVNQAFTGPELGEFPLPQNRKFILSFNAVDSSTYHLSLRVGNTMGTQLKITGKMEAFDKIKVENVMSLLMMPPRELVEIESYFSQNLPGLFKMIVNEQTLVMTGTTAEIQCCRYEKVFEPLTSY